MEISLGHAGADEDMFLSGLTDEGKRFFHRVMQRVGDAEPRFQGFISDFSDAHPHLSLQLRNMAKSCPRCGKSCAFNLPFCNGCNLGLTGAPSIHTENVCMGFVYGIEKNNCGSPLKLSLRLEEPDLLVYDDLLSRSSAHFNAIPTECHLPDWRHLLRNAARGLALLRKLEESCWRVALEQFWNNEQWRCTTLKLDAFDSFEEFQKGVVIGINAVPSQFQVHVQCILPALFPADYHAFLRGKRFVKDRWLPLEFVIESLEALNRSKDGGICNAHILTMEEIFATIEGAGGPRYEESHVSAIRRYNDAHRACANWRVEYFNVAVLHRHPKLRPELLGAAADSKSPAHTEVRPVRRAGQTLAAQLTPTELEKRDRLAIHNYGWPYDEAGQPCPSSYYKFSRKPGEVLSADEWVAGGFVVSPSTELPEGDGKTTESFGISNRSDNHIT